MNVGDPIEQTFHQIGCLLVRNVLIKNSLELAATNVLHFNHDELLVLVDALKAYY